MFSPKKQKGCFMGRHRPIPIKQVIAVRENTNPKRLRLTKLEVCSLKSYVCQVWVMGKGPFRLLAGKFRSGETSHVAQLVSIKKSFQQRKLFTVLLQLIFANTFHPWFCNFPGRLQSYLGIIPVLCNGQLLLALSWRTLSPYPPHGHILS